MYFNKMPRLFTVYIFAIVIVAAFSAPEVQLPNGLIQGRVATTYHNRTYYAFEKIPFAAPPTGERRFQAPVPPENWDEPLDVSYMDVSCYQLSVTADYESEDCLYLKVLTPQLPSGDNTLALPVMVSIYGGGFDHGTAMKTYADRVIEEDVIFVAMNYRLAIFGFLSTGDDVIPGNAGLKDQQLAIKWTHENIHLFGGDPDKITIYGQSAGSASCAYQLLNQDSTGLFQSAILESGSFLTPWAFQRNAKEIAFATAAFLDDTFKTNRDSKALLEFLQSVEPNDLEEASKQYSRSETSLKDTPIRQGFFWAPVIEAENPTAFITKKMYGLLEAGDVIKVPIMIGMTSEEAIQYTQDADALKKALASYDKNLGWIVPNDMRITDEDARKQMGEKIRNIYTGGESFADHLGDGVRMYTDTSFSRPIIKHAELYSQFAKTYFFQFSYDGVVNHKETQYEGAEHVGHGQETVYLYCSGGSCNLGRYSANDQLTSDRMIKLWTNFAKYQNPTPEISDLLQNITWPEVSVSDGNFYYLDIGENLEVRNHPKKATYSKWVDLYDSLGFKDFDTY